MILPIPDQSDARRRREGSRAHPIAIESRENAERAVNILEAGIAGENYYHRIDNPPYHHRAKGAIPELFIREGVLERLLAVNRSLRSLGLELYVFDAYRPPELQNYFHDEWVPRYLKRIHPEWEAEKIAEETGKYWAKGVDLGALDPLSPPPHATGGVVDLTLRREDDGVPLFMGSPFDALGEISFADHFEREAESRKLTPLEEEAREHRRILYHAMAEEGFTVNPNEWWHFGYGDQLSAKIAGKPFAVYSLLKL